jgi:DnaK suppressor protein
MKGLIPYGRKQRHWQGLRGTGFKPQERVPGRRDAMRKTDRWGRILSLHRAFEKELISSQQIVAQWALPAIEDIQMRQSEIADFKSILNHKLSELSRQLSKRDGITIERTPDALDQVHIATERELATRNLERESSVLREVRAALSRIEEGEFGLCLNCEEEISTKRLKALPWTALCLDCKEQEDRGQSRHSDQSHWLSSRAA